MSKARQQKNNRIIALVLIIAALALVGYMNKEEILNKLNSSINIFEPRDVKLNLMFAGDILFDRHIDELSQKSSLKYAYPFQGLNTLSREEYDAWIGNLECPVTEEQSTPYQKTNWLRFSCKKGYLPELKKYFDIVSIANNHTDNMNGRKGIEETRKNLEETGIKYFGDYDSSQKDKLCEVIYTKNMPIAYCGFHGVYSLPTDQQLKVISDYSKYFVTFVMPHQGVEYEFKSGTYQKRVYRAMIDNGADAVIGSHPHVIQEVETYKGKLIFYSLGNFIFDQGSAPTREHMTVKTEVVFPKYNNNYANLNCQNISNVECLKMAEELNIIKPEFALKYKPIFTHSDYKFQTSKKNLTEAEYQKVLKNIGFDKIASSSKTN